MNYYYFYLRFYVIIHTEWIDIGKLVSFKLLFWCRYNKTISAYTKWTPPYSFFWGTDLWKSGKSLVLSRKYYLRYTYLLWCWIQICSSRYTYLFTLFIKLLINIPVFKIKNIYYYSKCHKIQIKLFCHNNNNSIWQLDYF